MKAIRAIFRLFMLVTLAVVGLIIYVVARDKSEPSTVSSSRTTMSPPIERQTDTPAVVPPKLIDSAPSAPQVEQPVAQAFPPATVDITTVEASSKLADATKARLAILRSSAAYQSAAADAADKLAPLEAMRKSGTMDGRLEASSAYTKAASVVKKMEADAVSSDPDVRAAAANLMASRARDAQAVAQQRAKDEAAAVDAQQRAQLAADREYNDPINKAMREHRVIEGMSYQQAVQAVGRPNSITTSGNYRMAEWEITESNWWAATFIDNSAETVTHSRF